MSSPPPPPNPYTPTPISNPKMRRSTSGLEQQQQQQSLQQQAHKKPRMHPLRQTSFPASEDVDPRVFSATSTTAAYSAARSDIDTGSVTGSFTGSLDGVSAVGVGKKGGKGKGRTGRPRKNRDREGTPSLSGRGGGGSVVDGVGGGAGSVVDGDGGGGSSVRAGEGGSRVDGEGGDEEGEEDEEEDVGGQLFGGEQGATDTEAEKKNLAILIDAFDSAQSSRYNLFKRTKLRKEALRKMVNQVLSQSVPPSVVTTVNGYTKLFVGEIVERARIVQREWADAYDQLAIDLAEAQAAEAEAEAAAAAAAASRGTSVGNPVADKQTTPNGTPPLSGFTPTQTHSFSPSQNALPGGGGVSSMPPTPKPFKLPPNPHRSQLLPTHIREAHRRYKLDGEGGGVGYSGLSMKGLGTKGAVSCSIGGTGGRRLFR
ncbi:hypothetical protein FQN54_005308 [Arachnomyces sp. PD_36]|nr:hypothetical protein FQN54_005308 [Arachnomyces sp. PD_36]